MVVELTLFSQTTNGYNNLLKSNFRTHLWRVRLRGLISNSSRFGLGLLKGALYETQIQITSVEMQILISNGFGLV